MLILTFPGIQSWNWDKGWAVLYRCGPVRGKDGPVHPERKRLILGRMGTKNCYCRWAHHTTSQPESACCHFIFIYLWRNIVCFVLFCFVLMRSTEPGCFRSCLLGVFGKLWTRSGAWWAWFRAAWICRAKVLEYWMIFSLKIKRCKSSWILNDFFTENCTVQKFLNIEWFFHWKLNGAKVPEFWMIFSLKIKLNCSWNFRRNWNVPLVLLERSWWAGFNGIYLVRFGFQNVRDFYF